MQIVQLLLAADGSFEADFAESVLTRLPHGKLSVVVAMAVQPVGVPATPYGLLLEPGTVDTTAIQEQVASRTIRHVSERLKAQGIEAKEVLLQGDASNEILETIERGTFDMVIAGSRSKSSVEALFLGSVARKLAVHSPCSVLLGRKLGAETEDVTAFPTDPLSILVAVDGSAQSEQAVESLSKAPDNSFAHVFTLCVETEWGLEAAGDSIAPELQVATDSAKRLSKIAPVVTPLQARGKAAEAIVSQALEHQVDLIVIGAGRHHFLERLLIGSVAYHVSTHAPCSVLILRGPLDFS